MKLKVEERSYVEAKLKPPKEIWAVKRCNEGITIKKNVGYYHIYYNMRGWYLVNALVF